MGTDYRCVAANFADLAIASSSDVEREKWVSKMPDQGLNDLQRRYRDSFSTLTDDEQLEFLVDVSTITPNGIFA